MTESTPFTTCLHHLFEAQVERRPSAPAIVSAGTSVSYADLDGRANGLARHLRAQGVRAGDLVGLFLERSPDAVLAILAILKSGAAYVPLDPSHPTDRNRAIVEEAGIGLVVSDGRSAEAAHRLCERVVDLDGPAVTGHRESGAPLGPDEVGVAPTDLCYVLYTSGSTGRPKGVMTEHRNVVRFVAAFNRVIGLTETDRVFHGFSLSFDGSVEEMWMAFSNGAALVVPPRGSARFGNDLAELLVRGGATVFSTVPTALSMISEALESVRLLIVSGEPCPPELVRRWATPGRRMLNVYGPTETTVNATAAECCPDGDVTIGKPLPGYELLIADEDGRPVAPGVVGELYIGGPGVARGYINQAALTAKHFVPWPRAASSEGSARAYRTGDLVSLDGNGDVVFHGRLDQQVKLRGYRVELAEIEAVLCEHPSVRSAVVTLANRGGASELAAHLVAADGVGIDRAGVLSLLTGRLPTYMVPAFLDVLPELPLLSSGKVDRRRLPAPVTPLIRAERVVKIPRDELESQIHGAFEVVLENRAISIEDDFFLVLGGYSLLAARLVSRLRNDFGHDVSIRDVYGHATVASLAACIRARGNPRESAKRAAESGRFESTSRRVFRELPARTRHGSAALQLATLYVVYGLMALPFIAWFLPWEAYRSGALSSEAFTLVSIAASACVWPALLALSVAVKWLVVGRYRPGTYPLWGWYYLRWWIAQRFVLLATPGLMAGTPLLPLYLRLMGARVGRNCTIDSALWSAFDLLSIGDDTSIGAETQVLGYHVENGLLHLGSIEIGDRCFVGIHSSLGLDVRMENGSRLDDLSLLLDGATVPAGEGRRGSPGSPAEVAVPYGDAPAPSPLRRVVFGVLHFLMIYALGIALAPSLAPSAGIVWWADRSGSVALGIAALPVAVVVGLVAFCLWLPVLKWILLPRLKPGVYRVESVLYLRKWAVDVLLHMSRTVARPLYTTIFLPAWLRLLGAKIGRRAEISTVSQMSPELTDLGEHSFFADGSMIGGRRTHGGLIELAVSRVGRGSFVGNSAILPVGTSLGDRCLLGCLSAPPAGVNPTPDGSEWLGSPSFALPHRRKVEGFDETVTHEPTPKLIAQRIAVDALRIVMPCLIGGAEFEFLARVSGPLFARHSLSTWLAVFPAIVMVSAALGVLGAVAVKKVLIGTFRPIVRPLWSMFVWLNEAVNGTYETVAAPLLAPLLGTPFCAPWLRAMGCKIGRHVYLETTLFSEFDLVHIGDYAALNAGAVIQNHLFEDRIMKASSLKVGADCCVGSMAVVLYDTEMQPGSSIGSLSLLMKGETLPVRTRWVGIPTGQVSLVSRPLPALEAASDRNPTLAEGWS